VNVPKKEKKKTVNFVKQNILASKSRYQYRLNNSRSKNRLGVVEFPVDDTSFSKVRSMSSGRGSADRSTSDMARSKSQKSINLAAKGFTMNIYKQVNKKLPKPGIFISGSRTGREPLPREIRKTIRVEGSSMDLNA
jgi:hypothetical protein